MLFNPGLTSPLLTPCPNVVVIHDLQHLRHPEYFGFAENLALRIMSRIAVHRSRKVISVSKSTTLDLIQRYGIPPERIETIYHGVNPAFFDLQRTDSERLILCVAANRKHKNLGRLLRAFAALEKGYRLVLVGLRGPDSEALESLIAELGLTESVLLAGWVPDEELLAYYSRAHALVYPSLFEGFGLPVLEGLACGVPVACSDIPPLREVGGDSVLYFNPEDQESLTLALNRICSDAALRSELSRKGRLRAAGFTWTKAAEATLAILTAQSR